MDYFPHVYPTSYIHVYPRCYIHLGGTCIRVYDSIPIQLLEYQQPFRHPDLFTNSSLSHSHPLRHPFSWFRCQNEALIVHTNDLYIYQTRLIIPSHHSPLNSNTNPQHQPQQPPYDTITDDDDDELLILNEIDQVMNQYSFEEAPSNYIDDEVVILNEIEQVMNDTFEEAASNYNPSSGLTKRTISKKLRVTKYHQQQQQETDEICVVCQTEFRNRERVAILPCKHRYHPRCITDWLVRQNRCPICKSQALSV